MASVAVAERFQIVRCLGEGGMGVVYEALDRERATRVALKTLRHVTGESLARLKREFRTMQDLHHPNLVSLGDLVSKDNQWFFTMELVDGHDLLDYVRPTPSLEEVTPESNPSDRMLKVAPTVTFAPAAPNAPLFDEARLRRSFCQLADALCAMHSVGLVHRDIKSSNVRVTPGGRLVLLDFGLVIDTGTDNAWTQQAAGTPAYMAPEQAFSAMVGPEADWYALGVLLFEALTGGLPFDGSSQQVLARKQRQPPPAPSTLAHGIPPELDALCVALLSFDPTARPKGADVLRALGRASEPGSASGAHTPTTLFVGRAEELEALMTAFHDSRHGQPVTVIVGGDSGVGKTALVRQFAQRLTLEVPEAMVVAGRCFERESVPFKAFDGVVDALGRLLARLGPEAASMVPTKPAPLVQVFPVLRRVKVIAERTRNAPAEAAGLDLRTRAFASLRDLFTRLADRRPLLVIIDDAQWSDADSLALLADLLRPPEAPSLMLLLTARAAGSAPSGHEQGAALANALQGEVRTVDLGPLPEDDATALATGLLERSGVVDAFRAQWAAHQAAGHPLFLDMIMRRSDRISAQDSATQSLEDVLWAVIEELDPASRAILETVAVAAVPMHQETVRRAASVDNEAFAKALSVLRIAHLVQTSAAGGNDRVEPYHDRVRKAVLAHFDEARLAERHRCIVIALEASSAPDPEALVLHWRGAGDPERTAHYAAVAGEHATGALAFDRAADFFMVALSKGEMPASERRALQIKLAKVLESAGRGEEAAHAYLDAAEGAPPFQRVELERAAAVELLACGHLDEGTTVLRRVLADVGFKAPRSPLAAFCWLVAYNLWLRIVGLRFTLRTPDEIPREDLARVDAIFAAGMGFTGVDMVLGSCMAARHLIAALRSGDRARVLRATALQSARLATAGGAPSRFERQLDDVVTRLLDTDENAASRAFFDSARGYALYFRGRWRDALTMLDSSVSKAQSHSHAAGWRSNARLLGCWTLDLLGEYRELARRHAPYLADADRRGDLYASVQLRIGSLAAVWLAADQPGEARLIARKAIEQWPSTRYLVQHWQLMVGEAEISLYLGHGAEAYRRVERDAAALRKTLLLHTQVVRGKTLFLRGRCAIASLATAATDVQEARRTEARRLARKLEGERMPWMAPLAAILTAGVACAEGDDTRAASSLRAAIELAEGVGMAGYAAAARHQLGLFVGGEEGRDLVRRARTAMTEQAVRDPARFAGMLVPGGWRSATQQSPKSARIPQ